MSQQKLSRIYRSCVNDIEDVLGVTVTGSDEQRIIQSLMEAVDAAVVMVSDATMNIDVEISRLEDRVVEAAVAARLAETQSYGDNRDLDNLIAATRLFRAAVTDLIAARHQAEHR